MNARTELALPTTILLAGIAVCGGPPLGAQSRSVGTILQDIGVSKGVCAVVGDRALELSIRLVQTTELLLYVQLESQESVDLARRRAAAAGLASRLTITRGAPGYLHLADNVADALVAVRAVPEPEALRVLRPGGKALLGEKVLVKPTPEGVDDWSHPYHGPDNNPQSRDRVARAPYLTQFLADPRYAPLPQVAVAAAGRVFKAFGHIAFKKREEPLLNTLVAYNGYNGTELWRRPLTPGVMVHRNTMIATKELLFLGDQTSCKLLNAATGALEDEIAPPVEIAGGTFWKWMALEGGTLYALVGEDELRDPVVRQNRTGHGWPWDPLSPGFNQKRNPWGYGRTLLAIDVRTKRVLWHYREEQPIDSRSLCMKSGRIFFFRFGSYLGCLEATTGKPLWRKTAERDPGLFAAIGKDLNRQDWRTNWRTTAYLKCSDEALYLAGPMFEKLLAVSTRDGTVLWENEYSNFQLVLRDDGLYGISGPWGQNHSKKFDPLTGEVLRELTIGRRACTRPTGSVDAVFFRAQGGSVRLDVTSGRPHWVSPMRPQCQDGVTVANGLLYWWPSTCDCQLTLYGITSLGPAGDFDFAAPARESERLERAEGFREVAALPLSPRDWPTLRANNTGRATSLATVPREARVLWDFTPETPGMPTAPTAAGDLVFVAGTDGAVRALDAATGARRWTVHTGGAVRIAPTIAQGRLFVGSGDGRVHALEARSGRWLWRFRAAPKERFIPVYGRLMSTWPAASGVLVEDGVAYVAAGITNFDGTYVYALDAATGSIRWQNTTSGHLDTEARTGVSVQGHLLLHGGKLYLAGGTSVSPAIYDLEDGQCENDPAPLRQCSSIHPRGWELSLIGDHVLACGQPFYKRADHWVHDPSAIDKIIHSSAGGRDIAWLSNEELLCFDPIDRELLNRSMNQRKHGYMIPTWGKLQLSQKPRWKHACKGSRAIAHASNAVVVAGEDSVTALDLRSGKPLWTHALPAKAVPWGMAIDRHGRTIVSLEDGRVLCVGNAR